MCVYSRLSSLSLLLLLFVSFFSSLLFSSLIVTNLDTRKWEDCEPFYSNFCPVLFSYSFSFSSSFQSLLLFPSEDEQDNNGKMGHK